MSMHFDEFFVMVETLFRAFSCIDLSGSNLFYGVDVLGELSGFCLPFFSE